MRYERSLAVTKRLADLLALIRSGLYSSRAIAEKLGVSDQTVYRDILFLKQQGHSIRSVKLSSRWAYKLSKYSASLRQGRGARRI
jgi:DeoR/GlpR family transcriptional regulator of sugar metabolism